MAGLSSWIANNWFSVVQTLGFFLGFWFTAKTLQLGNLLTMSAQRDALWQRAQDDARLSRILSEDAELSKPPSIAEREFLKTVIILFQNGWRVAKTLDWAELPKLAFDAGQFFSLPLPGAVFEQNRKFLRSGFVKFVSRAREAAERVQGDS